MTPLKLRCRIGRYCWICITLLNWLTTQHVLLAASPVDEPITLDEKFRPGDCYRIETTSEVNGMVISKPVANGKVPDKIRKSGTAKSLYDERVIEVGATQLPIKTTRRYDQLSARHQLDDQPTTAQLRNQIKHLVLIREDQRDVTFSPDGPLFLGELEHVRTDVFFPRLRGLLPNVKVQPKQTWQAAMPAVQELTDLQKIESGQVDCTLQQLESLNGKKTAVVHFAGRVRGVSQMGLNEQTLQGKYHFSLDSNQLVFLQFEVTSKILDSASKPVGELTASFRLSRLPGQPVEVTGLALEPTEENTLLLVRESRLGLELTHSRRWVPRVPTEKQWLIDGPSGSGVTLQFESASAIPPAARIRDEVEAALKKSAENLVALQDPPGWSSSKADVQRLAWRGHQKGKDFIFEYFLWKSGDRGALIAARYFAPEYQQAQRDVEAIVRSLQSIPRH